MEVETITTQASKLLITCTKAPKKKSSVQCKLKNKESLEVKVEAEEDQRRPPTSKLNKEGTHKHQEELMKSEIAQTWMTPIK